MGSRESGEGGAEPQADASAAPQAVTDRADISPQLHPAHPRVFRANPTPDSRLPTPPLRITFDATAMPVRRAGAGVYTYHLARALAAALPDDAALTILDRRDTFADLDGARVRVEPLRLPGRARRILWEQTALPWRLRGGADVFHSPHHSLPLAPTGCPLVVTVHDVTFRLLPARYTRARRLYMNLITAISARRATQVIVPSASVRDDFCRLFRVPASRVAVVPEAAAPTMRPIEDARLLAEARGRLRLPDRFILSVGTLEPGKNRATLLRAFALLRARGLPHQLVITGQAGWGAESPLALAERLGVAGAVRLTGYVDDGVLPLLYNLAEAFVFPSWREGFGLPPLEALACGAPVVASDRPALPEVLGDAALYVPPNAPAALADALERLLTDDALHADLRVRGLARAAGYSWERAARETLAVYRRAITGA